MADKKISALTASSTPLAGTEVLPIVQSGATVKVSVDNLTVGKAVETGPLTVKKNQAGATTILAIQNGNAAASSDVALQALTANGTWTTSWGRSTALMKINSSNAIDVLTVAAAGDVTVSVGNLVIGTSGKGIDFSATAGTGTSELLNDYEEGTFTPTVTASSGTFTTVSATGAYTKIGRVVNFSIEITITTVGTASGAVIATLPFTPAVANCASMGRERNVTGYSLQGTISSGSANMTIQKYDNSSIITSSAILVMTGAYFT